MHVTYLRRNYVIAFLIAITFALSSLPAAYSQSTPTASPNLNWQYSDGNVFNQNFNPQTVINSSNAGSLTVDWIWPVPGTPAEWAASAAGTPDIGVGLTGTPIVYDGVIYAFTNFNEVFAINAGTGQVVWSTTLPFGPNATAALGISILPHYHNSAIAFTTKLLGGPMLWIAADDFKVYALDADTGNIKLSFADLSGTAANHYGIAGNEGIYSDISPGLVIDQNNGIVVTSAAGTSSSISGRGFFAGWNVTSGNATLAWRVFTNGPQDGSNPNWAIQNVANMTGAWIFNGTGAVNLKTLSPSVENATLYNDWGFKENATCSALLGGKSPGGVGSSWGGPWVIDPNTGIAYVATNNRNPYDSPCTPGPDLWASSILAINTNTGEPVWGFQSVPHDSWDWDCSWNQALANETIAGQTQEVVIKTCKSGYMVELNAQTGQMYWSFTAPDSIIKRCQYCNIYNPLNQTQMDSAYPSPIKNGAASFLMSPGEAGGFENDFAYSPVSNMVYAVDQNDPFTQAYVAINSSDYATASGTALPGGFVEPGNSTVFAVNAATGQEVWHYFIPDIGYRGGVTVSGNVAYLTLSTGYLIMLNAMTGAVIGQKLIGGPLNNLPAIAATASGQEEMILPISTGIVTWAQSSPPGDIIVLTLPSTTSSSSGSQTSTATGAVSTSVSTVFTTVSGSASTVTVSTGSATSNAELYGVAAVAAIFIIATGILATRRGRKPAS